MGEVKGKLESDRNTIRFQQTNLGHMIAEAQRERASAGCGDYEFWQYLRFYPIRKNHLP